jgi:hypothetical protein
MAAIWSVERGKRLEAVERCLGCEAVVSRRDITTDTFNRSTLCPARIEELGRYPRNAHSASQTFPHLNRLRYVRLSF